MDVPGTVHPTASRCSMSALRLGPVTIARALGRPPQVANSWTRLGAVEVLPLDVLGAAL